MRVLVASSERYGGCIVDALLRNGHEVVGVVSPMKGIYDRQHFGPRFWAYELRGWSMLNLCKKRNIQFRVVRDLNDGSLMTFVKQQKPDLLIVFGWPTLVSDKTLSAFLYGGMNIHPSYLPKLRGPDPLFYVVDRGAEGFGISFHRIVQELDAGPLFHQVRLISGDGASYDQLYCRILDAIFNHLPKALDNLVANSAGTPQRGEPTTVSRFRVKYRVLNPDDLPEAIIRRTRACYSHHPRVTAVGDVLLTFTRCKTMPYKDLVHKQPGSIQRVGTYSLEVNLSGRYMVLSGVRVFGSSWWSSPFQLASVCRAGQTLANSEDVLKMAKEQELL